jgi:molybdopterin/thiamine biosynthesis adenylyltransferase
VTLNAIKSVDLVVSCVDSFLVREQINAFCRRHLIPLIDIGMNIKTEGEQLERAEGQTIVVLPDSACLRCTPLLSDAVLERERQERPPGYDVNAYAQGDPQVVSMNGVLASEACNSVLDLITGYAAGCRGAAWWGYDGQRGELTRYNLPAARRSGCPACAERGQGDPLL